MAEIRKVVMPRTDQGNDPADNADNVEWLTDVDRLAEEEARPPVVTSLLQHISEDNVALAFAQLYRDKVMYANGRGRWFRWIGSHWQEDETGFVWNEIRNLSRKLNTEGKVSPARSGFVDGVEKHLKRDPIFSRHIRDFDADTNLLNTPAGTIDLRTLSLRPHNPSDNITSITAVSSHDGGGERFRRFLSEITDEDAELVRFHQESLGACLSGAIEGHWLLFWYGHLSRNGKNTLGDLVYRILNDYAGTMPTSALMHKQNESHPTELMNLKGKRLVVSSEVPEGSYWNEARLKETTGDTTLQGHYMRQDWVAFPRTHKHLIYGNHQPQLRNVDPAIQARFRLVPFPVSFVGREDPDLPDKLWREASYVLHWLMEGHRRWRENGKKLTECDAVRQASTDYFASQSSIDMWVEERCRKASNNDEPACRVAKASVLFADYQHWKQARGESPVSMTRWGIWMAARYKKVVSSGVRYYGIELLNSKPAYGYE